MPDRRVEDFAFANKISFNEAKRRMGRRARGLGPINAPPKEAEAKREGWGGQK